MTKDEKGITIVTLVITLIVMLIIFGITFATGTVLLERAKITKIETELYLIKARAETLAEQYSFDGNFKNLLSFSELEKKNANPVAYNYGRENNLAWKSDSGKNFNISSNTQFKNDINKIYGVNTTSAPSAVGSTYGKYLFVKWGLDECVSQGIIKSGDATDQKFLKNAIINDKSGNSKYAIVVYDLQVGNVASISYSIGVRNHNGEIEYTLDDIMEIDVEEDE